MKRIVEVYGPETYFSGPTGGIRAYHHRLDLCDVLGQPKSHRLQVLGHRRSANARLTLLVFETSVPRRRPELEGQQVGSSIVVTTLRPGLNTIAGPFAGRVEIVAQVDASTGTNTEEFDFEVWTTMLFDE